MHSHTQSLRMTTLRPLVNITSPSNIAVQNSASDVESAQSIEMTPRCATATDELYSRQFASSWSLNLPVDCADDLPDDGHNGLASAPNGGAKMTEAESTDHATTRALTATTLLAV